MDCNGMRHRGPTSFGMLLTYSGCSAEPANTTVNKIWGLNGVNPAVRLAIIQKAYDYGQSNPEQSGAFRAAFTK